MITIDPRTVTAAQLRRAADFIEQIEKLGTEFRQLFRNPYPETSTQPIAPKRRRMSTAGRQAISNAQKRRWQAHGKAFKTKRVMSPQTKAKIAAAACKRWAKVREAGRNSL